MREWVSTAGGDRVVQLVDSRPIWDYISSSCMDGAVSVWQLSREGVAPMELKELLGSGHVVVMDPPASKEALFDDLLSKLCEIERMPDIEDVRRRLLEREVERPTILCDEIALPHCFLDGIEHTVLLVCRIRGGLDFGLPDRPDVRLLFLAITPEGLPGQYLRLLARIATILSDEAVRERMLQVEDAEELRALLLREDERIV